MENPLFWSVVKANFIVAACSILFSIVITLAIAFWRRRKMKKISQLKTPETSPSPRVIMFGGVEPKSGHCPLCGQGWPLPGPVLDHPEQPK